VPLARARLAIEEGLDALGRGLVLVVLREDESRSVTGSPRVAMGSGRFGSVDGLGHEAPV
jgi:hypothetical protein